VTPRRGWLLVITTLAFAAHLAMSSTSAAETVTTIRSNGASANRVDLVIMGDGFTAAQIASGFYAAKVEEVVRLMFAQEPYLEYNAFFNLHRIDVVSVDPGADHPSAGLFVNTALDAAYDCGGITRLICVSTSKVNAVLAGTTLPADARDVTLVLVNDGQYGGSGGQVTVASLNASVVELILHEMGHSFALLADEYGGPPPPPCTTTEPPQVNATMETKREFIKWRHWIDPSTPLPTASNIDALPGLYQGAAYCDVNMYRPTFNSKMRSVNRPFEQINTEQHIRRIYNLVSPIDTWSPLEPAVVVDQAFINVFSVFGPRPRTHNLEVVWRVDGVPVAAGPQFSPNVLSPGSHRLEATVRDTTPMVRSDPSALLVDVHAWDVTVRAADPGALPSDLAVTSIVGNTVTIAWRAPTAFAATGYALEGGVTPGQVLASIPTGSTATSFTFTAPTGAFYIRIHALNGSLKTGPSNELRIFVNVPAPPSAPVNLLAAGDGSTLALAWKNTTAGGAAQAIVLDVSGAITTALMLPVAEMFSYSGVPPGTYTLSVRAANGSGSSPSSNPVTLTFPTTCVAPATPTNVSAAKSGSTVTVSWDLAAAGAAPTGYRLIIAGAFVGTIPLTTRTITAVAAPGTYTFSVVAINSCGASQGTAATTVVVP
jgi:hypothetical protein